MRLKSYTSSSILILTLFLFPSTLSQASPIREVTPNSSKLIPIHTSLGYSTILEFQEKPVSSILGDQDAFKLEYVGNSITLKPLFHSAKSNLFIYTGFDRFNFAITTTPPPNTDYVVRIIKSKDEKPSNSSAPEITQSPYTVIPFNLKSSRSGFTLKVQELDLARDIKNPRSASLIKFDLASNGEDHQFVPASFGLKQEGKFLDVEGIYLEKMTTSKKQSPTTGVIAVLNQQWKRSTPLTLVFAFEREIKNKRQSSHIQVTFNTNQKTVKKEKLNGKTGLFQVPHS